ncbi:hypothetical protein TRFO_31253 [Tritrichomonas foetus]|uniref:RING-type domain-containing protein n=1 Tax=Tritrichomonas foetus TaxID=1144522 RepID=A0A1J4JWY3_9EUKA|nr:hypothetical protein TRFO_31253 [Tritrichomonas foetus]|eukprot:OHT01781.1 hypothetical protein TRFO_31253 [Tritrichomonas foetus]
MQNNTRNNNFFPETEADKYVKIMVFFATSVVIFISVNYIKNYLFISTNFAFFLIYFEVDKSKSLETIHNILETSFYYTKKPENSIFHSIQQLFFAVLSFALLYNYKGESTFFICYFEAFLRSLQIFLLASSIKSFLLWSEIITQKQIRRGFLGILVRLTIAIRKIFMIPIWTNYIESIEKSKLQIFVKFAYLIISFISFGWILNDLKLAFKNYIYSISEHLKEVDPSKIDDNCAICLSEPIEPIELPCGHIHCYDCTYKWLKTSSTCPTCRSAVYGTKLMDFADGDFPPSVLIFNF